MPETHHTFCRICEALCGLEVTVDHGRIVDLRPDRAHVATRGAACVKGLRQHRLYGTPDRLLRPLKRTATGYVPLPWDQALAEIGAKVRQLRGVHPDAVAMYVGTAAGFSVLHPVFAQGFMTGIGSRNLFASATQDCSNKFAVARLMYGFPFTQPFPDLDHVDCLILVGANPVVSRWSFLQVPHPAAALREIAARGGRIFHVDPRRTETARVAGEHVPVRPGTDVFFYLAFLHELIQQGGVDAARLAAHTTGWEAAAAVATPWTPERVAPVTGIPAHRLRELVTAYRTARGAALHCSTGVNMGGQGGLAFWLQEVINLASGNLDRTGGLLVGRGVIDFARFGRRTGTLLRSDRSRVGGFMAVNDAFPGGILADEILTPGPGQVRGLFVTGGNPLLTMANAGRLRAALGELELLVCLDVQQGETASLAHYVLPCTSPLERPDLPFIFPLMLGLQRTPYLQATRAVLPPPGECRDEATIYTQLARASGAPLFGSRVVQTLLEAAMRLRGLRHPGAPPAVPQEGLLDLLLRVTGQPGFAALLGHPHGWLRPSHRANDLLGRRVVTDDGKVHLAPPELLEAARGLDARFMKEQREAGQLRMITRRSVGTHNSWTHNLPDLVPGGQATNYLYLHPEDARQRGIAEGDLADVTSEIATVRIPVRLLPDLAPGTCALPHGWGHQHAAGLSVARRTRGVNANLLAADGPDHLEPLTGMARLTAIPVDVTLARGPRDPSTWSGLPDR
jgi:formate dehydrogenase